MILTERCFLWRNSDQGGRHGRLAAHFGQQTAQREASGALARSMRGGSASASGPPVGGQWNDHGNLDRCATQTSRLTRRNEGGPDRGAPSMVNVQQCVGRDVSLQFLYRRGATEVPSILAQGGTSTRGALTAVSRLSLGRGSAIAKIVQGGAEVRATLDNALRVVCF